MKPIGIDATPRSKQLIGNFIKAAKEIPGLPADKTHLHYSLYRSAGKENSLILTDLYKNKPEANSNKLMLNGIEASINGDTGNITLEKKPFWYIGKKGIQKAVKKIMDFLEYIQPENLAKKTEIKQPEKQNCARPYIESWTTRTRVLETEVNGKKIQETIEEKRVSQDYTPE